MTAMLHSLAVLSAAVPPPAPGRPAYVYVLAAACVLLIAAGIVLLVLWLRARRNRDDSTAYVNPAQVIAGSRLREIWDKFVARLPGLVRIAIADYSHFVVLGNTGSGKSALISRKVDWQGQTSQFIPSFTADPLLQIYLGSKTLVEEFSATVQDATARGYNRALKNLWGSLDVDQVPTVVIVLSASMLANTTPDQLRRQAQLVRGKINILSEACGGTARVRLCLTHMDRVRGYSELARFLFKHRIPLELDLGTEASGDLVAGLLAYERHLPRALTTQPLSSFESIVEFLRSAETLLGPVVSFVQALSDRDLTSQRPEVLRLYFSSLSNDEQVSNPFDPPPVQRSAALGSLLSRWLRPLGIRPLHALLAGGLFAIGLAAITYVTRQHHGVVLQAEEAGTRFTQAVERARTALSSGESDVVRRTERHAGSALVATAEAEARFGPLRLIYRPDKRDNERRFVEGIRRGYLMPSLDRAIRQRARDKILSALVALYATRENTLGVLIKAQPTDWSTELGVPRDTLLDYIRYSGEPWTEVALWSLPPLLESVQQPVTELGPWRMFFGDVSDAVKRPFITGEELAALQQRSEVLRGALVQIRRGALLRQLYRNLAEETPLDMVKLFGRELGVLTPHTWLTDNQESLDRVLTMVRESNIRLEKSDTKSLYQLLRWLNEDAGSPARTGAAAPSPADGEVTYFLFPNETRSYAVSRPEWEALIARSRKRIFSLDGSGGSHAAVRHSHACDRTRPGSKHRSHGCKHHRAGSAELASTPVRTPTDKPLPLWSQEEFAPKLAALLTGSDVPAIGLSDVYNRVVYQREVLPLVQELKKALGNNHHLSPEEKIALSHRVQGELAAYARGYCEALLRYHLGYRVSGHSVAALHADLLDLIKPGSRFVARLRTLVDNVKLVGLEEPYLQPLASCLADFRPIVELMEPKMPASGGVAAAPSGPSTQGALGSKPENKAENKPESKPENKPENRPESKPEGKPEGLGEFNAAVAKLIEELDRADSLRAAAAPAAGAEAPGTAALGPRLSPLGRSALAMHEGSEQSPLRQAEQFLDRAGVGGPLRRPFLAPFLAVYQSGANEIENVLASHWRDVLSPQLAPLFARFPFARDAEREVAPAELDILSERKGLLFTELRSLYAPAVNESGGVYTARRGSLGTLRLPADLLPRVNTLARLSRALFAPDGNRKPLQLSIRGLPGPQALTSSSAQPALAFLQIGKAAAYGFNQQPSAVPLTVEWWAQGAGVVGVESSAATGRKHSQTLEVTDSAWSLFRLLQRSTLDRSGVSTWRIAGDGANETQAIRFVLTPDPWELFGAHTR